jgi:hypothetical protein
MLAQAAQAKTAAGPTTTTTATTTATTSSVSTTTTTAMAPPTPPAHARKIPPVTTTATAATTPPPPPDKIGQAGSGSVSEGVKGSGKEREDPNKNEALYAMRPDALPHGHPQVFFSAPVLRRRDKLIGCEWLPRHLVVFADRVCLYESAANPLPEESVSWASFSDVKSSPQPLERSQGTRTFLSLASERWSAQQKGKPLVFACGSSESDPRREELNLRCFSAVRNRLLRWRYATVFAASCDPRMVAFLDEAPHKPPGSLNLDGQQIHKATFQLLLLLLEGSGQPSRPISALSLVDVSLSTDALMQLLEVLSAPPPFSCGLGRLDLGLNPALNSAALANAPPKKKNEPPAPVVAPVLVSLLEHARFLFELKYLGLAGLRLGDAGVAALAGALSAMCDGKQAPRNNRYPCKLRWLDLSANDIGDSGFTALLQAWAAVSELTLCGLSLTANYIGDVGAFVFSTAARNPTCNFKLNHLRLAGNRIGDKGAEALAVAINKHRSLLELDLSDNPISDAGMDLFLMMIEKEDTPTPTPSPVGSVDSKGPPSLLSHAKAVGQAKVGARSTVSASGEREPPHKSGGPPPIPSSSPPSSLTLPPAPAKRAGSAKAVGNSGRESSNGGVGPKQSNNPNNSLNEPLEAFTVADLLRRD